MKITRVRIVFYPRPPSLLCRTLYSTSVFLQTHITTHFMCRILTQLSMGLPGQTLQQPRNEVRIGQLSTLMLLATARYNRQLVRSTLRTHASLTCRLTTAGAGADAEALADSDSDVTFLPFNLMRVWLLVILFALILQVEVYKHLI